MKIKLTILITLFLILFIGCAGDPISADPEQEEWTTLTYDEMRDFLAVYWIDTVYPEAGEEERAEYFCVMEVWYQGTYWGAGGIRGALDHLPDEQILQICYELSNDGIEIIFTEPLC